MLPAFVLGNPSSVVPGDLRQAGCYPGQKTVILHRKRVKMSGFSASALIFLTLVCVSSEPTPKPQLDLPPLPPSSSTPEPEQPTVLPNSYAGEPEEEARSSRDYDSDRSQRFGPPYENDDAYYRDRGRYNDRPYNYDERMKYSRDDDRYYANPGYPGSSYNNDDDRYYANRGRNPGSNPYTQDDEKYYRQNPYDDRYRDDRYRDDRYRDDRYRDDRYRDDRYRDDRYRDDRYRDDRYGYDRDRGYQQQNDRIARYLEEVDRKSSEECFLNVAAQWNFETNVNEATQLEALTAQQRYSEFQRAIWDKMKFVDRSTIFDDSLWRQVNLMGIIGASALPPAELDRYNRLINDMLVIYNGASICGYEQPFHCGLRLQPHLKDIMAKSRDWEELTWIWIEWRRKSGRIMRELFEQLVDLTNEAARWNNFTNAEEYWSFPFESLSFREEMEQVWNEVLPLYEMIHAYTRRKLREFYGPDKINRNAPIPDHILGNMYGQSWSNILDIIIPYPGRSFLEVTPAMNAQGYTPLVMFQLAEEFFVSLNMTPLPPQFWINSLLEEPPDRPVLCQPSAWDFCNGQDYRIKMCTTVTHKDLITAHHEMAHIQYFYNYRNLPKVFRDGANPGFHEAVGDAIGLSVSTPRHLQTLGLVHKSVDDTAHDINFLFALAMDKVVFLPFALALEAWRLDIFSKKINKEQYNCHWWLLRERYGGIKPPVLRSELDFDPGSKYHVPANIPYSRYFVGIILQFQLHRAMCLASRQFDPSDPEKPLHKCDIYRHPEAGNLLKDLMSKGASQPWREVLQETIGEGRLDGSALREFFKPLEEWLRQENLRNQEFVGWMYDGDYCKHSIETANLQVIGGFYNSVQRLRASLHIIAASLVGILGIHRLLV